jgi:hypothetical protein
VKHASESSSLKIHLHVFSEDSLACISRRGVSVRVSICAGVSGDPRSVYCNTLDDLAPLAEGRCSPARLRRPCSRREPETRETSLRLFFVTDSGEKQRAMFI